MSNLVFLDTETTGLDPTLHEVWELAYAYEHGEPAAIVLPHSLQTADPEALRLNGYWSRRMRLTDTSADADLKLRQILTGQTIVGANPAFDTAFLRARWGVAPWHHRLIDVESMALPVLGYDRPNGLHGLAADLRERGHDVPEPDHSAAADVATTRAVYNALRAEATK